jgi:hypothetical protein
MMECNSDTVPGIEARYIVDKSVTISIRYHRHQSTVAASVYFSFTVSGPKINRENKFEKYRKYSSK